MLLSVNISYKYLVLTDGACLFIIVYKWSLTSHTRLHQRVTRHSVQPGSISFQPTKFYQPLDSRSICSYFKIKRVPPPGTRFELAKTGGSLAVFSRLPYLARPSRQYGIIIYGAKSIDALDSGGLWRSSAYLARPSGFPAFPLKCGFTF